MIRLFNVCRRGWFFDELHFDRPFRRICPRQFHDLPLVLAIAFQYFADRFCGILFRRFPTRFQGLLKFRSFNLSFLLSLRFIMVWPAFSGEPAETFWKEFVHAIEMK